MRLVDRLERWWLWRRYRRQFKFYARSAYLARPELITNPQGISLSWGAIIRPYARLECFEHAGQLGQLEIDEGSNIHYYFHAAAASRIAIGKQVLIASRVYITDHDHAMPWKNNGLIARPVVIGAGCWLGEGCCILKGVELGENCVVGANAVVTRSFPAGSIVGGVPAKVIGRCDGKG